MRVMFFCDRDCFNCKYDDCKMPQNDVSGEEKRQSKELDDEINYLNADDKTRKVIKKKKKDRKEYFRQYMNDRNHGIKNRRKYRAKVVCLTKEDEKVAVFESMALAAEMVSGSVSAIHGCCTGKRKTHKGYKWKLEGCTKYDENSKYS